MPRPITHNYKTPISPGLKVVVKDTHRGIWEHTPISYQPLLRECHFNVIFFFFLFLAPFQTFYISQELHDLDSHIVAAVNSATRISCICCP